MSSAAARSNVVSLDDYRRSRGDRRSAITSMRTSAPVPLPVAPVWVYWVPVWVW
jgi:hypothetical protein